MGAKNVICCSRDSVQNENQNEERFLPVSSLNPQLNINHEDQIDEEIENLQKFTFSYENILKYISTSYEITYKDQTQILEKLPLLKMNFEDLSSIQQVHERETVYIWTKSTSDYKTKKYILKALRFNYDETEISPQDIKHKYPLQYFINKNIFKEMRIIRNHKTLAPWFAKLQGYIIDENNYKLYFVYDYYENSLEKFIRQKTLDFNNKMRIMRMLLELIKNMHCEGIISLDISTSSIRFTQNYNLKLVSLGNSFDMKSVFDIDRNSKMERNKMEPCLPPEIVLKHLEKINWHSDIWSLGVIFSLMFGEQGTKEIENLKSNMLGFYKEGKVPEFFYENIDNVFIKAIIVGMLRIDPIERPNVFEVIDVYNNLVKHLHLDECYLLSYTKEEVLCKREKNFFYIENFFLKIFYIAFLIF
jgi:serine/threonine protein kinase